MEKAIDIKRRAQRCIQNGDLDGALNEYEKLVGSEDSDPYNYVLLADLLYKKGDQAGASARYLSAVSHYEHASLYKNAIAVCKKMLRLSLSPAKVLQALGNLHALDGLAGEAALYYVQYAEHMVHAGSPADAAQALRQAFDVCQDNIRVLEQLAEAALMAAEPDKAKEALAEAAMLYRQRGAEADARRCDERASHLENAAGGAAAAAPARTPATPAATSDDAAPFAMARVPSAPVAATPAAPTAPAEPPSRAVPATVAAEPRPAVGEMPSEIVTAAAPLPTEISRMSGFETGRHETAWPARSLVPAEIEPLALEPAAMPRGVSAELPVDIQRVPATDEVVIVDREDEADEYVIEDESASYEEVARGANASVGATDSDGTYEIADEDVVPLDELPTEKPEADPVYEIADDDVVTLEKLPAGQEEDPVYEIGADEVIPADAPTAAAATADAVYEVGEDALAEPGTTPQAPGLASRAREASGTPAPTSEGLALAEVEALLAAAQEQFRAGDRDQASHTLTHAAQAYESLDRLENAAAIYRSLGKGAHATSEILELWLGNCERRHDAGEAAMVACDLGDRALNDGDEKSALVWFERARSLDHGNETARRRMERLAPARAKSSEPVALATAAVTPPSPAQPPVSQAPAVQPPAPPPPPQDQRVEIAVGRAEAVSFDLAGLLAEFQRGVESQLAGDAQSHYDLGMTYREMGLHEQAMDSFRNAEQDPRFTVRAAEMAARCLAEQGRHAEAAGEFQRALALPGITEENDIELRFHFASSLVELGRLEEALPEFEQVAQRMPDFEDVELRLDALRRTLGRG